MLVVFYDRKNRREVRSDKLMAIRLVETMLVCDPDDMVPTGRRLNPETHESWEYDPSHIGMQSWQKEMVPRSPHPREAVIGTVGYKSNNCPSYQNWDLFCTENDLVFVRFEDEPATPGNI